MFSRSITAALALAAALAAAPAFAQTATVPAVPGGFTAADLARACGPSANDANAPASRAACYATLVSIGQVHAIYTSGRQAARPVFCLPDPSPSLETVSAAYVAWVAANQQYAGVRAAEGVLRFAAASYPCAAPAAPARRR
ncbi:Rap1a/Tai family immunity protein [Roseomonas rosulenta]|uniref:Rap1a/Tai family immunity protein n=1 Tax=Roseomonas rosulenta TaxID=2748667 RepID=UPI0018DF4E44|nr:Rap1a/Tai family immunity protein [Roseomonas rosulenta]